MLLGNLWINKIIKKGAPAVYLLPISWLYLSKKFAAPEEIFLKAASMTGDSYAYRRTLQKLKLKWLVSFSLLYFFFFSVCVLRRAKYCASSAYHPSVVCFPSPRRHDRWRTKATILCLAKWTHAKEKRREQGAKKCVLRKLKRTGN